jgi:hypothetical protein
MSAIPTVDFINNNCTNRKIPSLLRDRKTEALLVFTRTALERYFAKVDQSDIETNDDITYVYSTLRTLLTHLQESVVNVDYLVRLSQLSNKHPELKVLSKLEEPIMAYYDIMAQQVKNHFHQKTLYLPEFLVICVLGEWILGEEKSTHIYPFLDDIDFLELIGKFEIHRHHFYLDGDCKISEIHELSFKIVKKLKKYKYKANKNRFSCTKQKLQRHKQS